MLFGVGLFDFCLSGSIIIVNNINEAIGNCRDRIVVIKHAKPNVVLLFQEAKCILCENGSLSCHLALLAREMSIPCILGIKGITELQNGTSVRVQTINGVGRINEISTL